MNHRKFVIIVLLVLGVFGFNSVHAQTSNEHYIIGLVIGFGNEAFIDEMTTLGYIEGENVTYLIPDYDVFMNMDPAEFDLEAFMAEYNRQIQAMMDASVDVFVTNTDTDAVGLQAITGGRIPTVFARSDDPIATGAVESLLKPGRVITGTITNRPHERRLQILTEIMPETDSVYYLYSPFTGEAEVVLNQVQAVAEELGVVVNAAPIMDGPSGVAALQNAPEGTDWFFLTPYVPFDMEFTLALTEISTAQQIGIAGVTDLPTPGYLVGYGPNIDETNRQSARIVDRILRGGSPSDLPVETAENYLTINLEAAEAINWNIPQGILRQANTIVRPGFFEDYNPFGFEDFMGTGG
jgi:putative tryptophan/tyrosine transport system substrate-binding protein